MSLVLGRFYRKAPQDLGTGKAGDFMFWSIKKGRKNADYFGI